MTRFRRNGRKEEIYSCVARERISEGERSNCSRGGLDASLNAVLLAETLKQSRRPTRDHLGPGRLPHHLLESAQDLSGGNYGSTTKFTLFLCRPLLTLRNMSSNSTEGVCHLTTALQNQKKS